MPARITDQKAKRLAQLVALAATPLFGAMAVASAIAMADAGSICGAPPTGPAGSMSFMYALMALVHAPAWLRLAAATAERT